MSEQPAPPTHFYADPGAVSAAPAPWEFEKTILKDHKGGKRMSALAPGANPKYLGRGTKGKGNAAWEREERKGFAAWEREEQEKQRLREKFVQGPLPVNTSSIMQLTASRERADAGVSADFAPWGEKTAANSTALYLLPETTNGGGTAAPPTNEWGSTASTTNGEIAEIEGFFPEIEIEDTSVIEPML